MRHVREKLISPLIVLCLADLMLDTNISHMFTLQPFHHNHCLCLRIPFPSFHGCLSFQPFYSLSRSPVLMGCSIIPSNTLATAKHSPLELISGDNTFSWFFSQYS